MSYTGTPSRLDATPHVRAVAEAGLRLELVLRDARAIQWYPAPVPRPDTDGRRPSGISDPVPAIAGDWRRIAVREAVVESERMLDRAVDALAVARRRLEHALAEARAE